MVMFVCLVELSAFDELPLAAAKVEIAVDEPVSPAMAVTVCEEEEQAHDLHAFAVV